MARSITFTLEGPVDTLITITELDDGTLRFDIEVLGSALLGDLRGIFFDMGEDDASSAGLAVAGVDGSEDIIGNTNFAEQAVDRVERDVNVKGEVVHEQGKFDGGIEFGTPGIGEDDVSSVSFILSANYQLSLDTFDLANFGLRYTSVGDETVRNDSAKIWGDASGVARNDAWEVDENDAGTVDLLENDTNGVQADGTRKTVTSVFDDRGDLTAVAGGFSRTVVIDGLVLGTLVVSTDGFASFTADGADVDKLAHDDIRTWSFNYETVSTEGDLATADVVLTIDGQNDQPVAYDIALTVGEDDGFVLGGLQNAQYGALTGAGVTSNFIGSDIDIGDVLSFQIISDPTDANGNQYGSVVNNGDGTFTFNPGDEFQFLDAGESREVTFQYVAMDDSGVGSMTIAPEEVDTSFAATISVTVVGADDDPIEFADQLLFETSGQSMFGTGDALNFQPALPFFGFDTSNSLTATIIPSYSFSGGALEGILDGIESVVNAIADVGCTIAGWFGADCDPDVDLPSSISTPSVRTEGDFDAKVGLQPYFSFSSGEVDASIPVDVVFTTPRQVENGDTFTITSAYTTDGGATFSTASPNVNFGMDFVFDLDTALDLFVGSTKFDIWDIDTGGNPDFQGELGEAGFNIFDASGEDLEFSVPTGPLEPFVALDLNFPVIETTGSQDVPGGDTLSSTGEDDVAVLTTDLDAIASQLLFGFPNAFGGGDDFGLSTSVAGVNLNLLSVEWSWDIVSLALETTLKAVQDFSLSIEDLPLMAVLEDGSTITGISLGDDISVDTPTTSTFDADIDGDADGLIDVDVNVDMEALFANDSWLGLDLDLFAGLLQFSAGITSDFFSGPSVSLFDDIIPSIDGNNDGFLLGDTFNLVDSARLATLFDEEFPIEGWNSDTSSLYFDVA